MIFTYGTCIILAEGFHPEELSPSTSQLQDTRMRYCEHCIQNLIRQTCCMQGLQPQCFETQQQKVLEFIFLGRTQISVDMTSIWHRFLFQKTFRKLTYHIYFNDILLHKHEVMHSCGTYDYQTNYEQHNKQTQAKKSHPYIA